MAGVATCSRWRRSWTALKWASKLFFDSKLAPQPGCAQTNLRTLRDVSTIGSSYLVRGWMTSSWSIALVALALAAPAAPPALFLLALPLLGELPAASSAAFMSDADAGLGGHSMAHFFGSNRLPSAKKRAVSHWHIKAARVTGRMSTLPGIGVGSVMMRGSSRSCGLG